MSSKSVPVAVLRRLLPSIGRQYSEHPDVVAVGLGEKVQGSDGNESMLGRLAIVFFVGKKVDDPQMPLPRAIDLSLFSHDYPEGTNVDTDVVERAIDAWLFSSAGGAEIQVEQVSRIGTLGVALQDRDARHPSTYGVTNAHVVARPEEDARGRQVKHGSGVRSKPLGEVYTHTLVTREQPNYGDYALIYIPSAVDVKTNCVRWPQGDVEVVKYKSLSESPFAGSRKVLKYGASGRLISCYRPRLIARHILELEGGGNLVYCDFYHLEVRPDSAATPRGGDSGSLLASNEPPIGGLVGKGLVIGGGHDFVLAFSWGSVKRMVRKWVSGIG